MLRPDPDTGTLPLAETVNPCGPSALADESVSVLLAKRPAATSCNGLNPASCSGLAESPAPLRSNSAFGLCNVPVTLPLPEIIPARFWFLMTPFSAVSGKLFRSKSTPSCPCASGTEPLAEASSPPSPVKCASTLSWSVVDVPLASRLSASSPAFLSAAAVTPRACISKFTSGLCLVPPTFAVPFISPPSPRSGLMVLAISSGNLWIATARLSVSATSPPTVTLPCPTSSTILPKDTLLPATLMAAGWTSLAASAPRVSSALASDRR
jgi:hypothetical protein